MDCERCGVPWPESKDESQKLMKRLMDGDTLSTEELMKLQDFDGNDLRVNLEQELYEQWQNEGVNKPLPDWNDMDMDWEAYSKYCIKHDPKYAVLGKPFCILCKHLFQITLNWRRFPHEVL